jgi:hypothetical protein
MYQQPTCSAPLLWLQAQHMVMDTLALAVSASANYLLRHQEARRMMLPLVAFPICAVGDLFCIYRELKAVQLRTLNRERGEMITERWLQCQQVGLGRLGVGRRGVVGSGRVRYGWPAVFQRVSHERIVGAGVQAHGWCRL